MLTLKIENGYSCGRESVTRAEVESPPADLVLTGDPWEDDSEWFETHIYNNTGDGHSCGSSDDALYDVYVEDSDDRADLVGMHWEIG